jgi:hypothetical protein
MDSDSLFFFLRALGHGERTTNTNEVRATTAATSGNIFNRFFPFSDVMWEVNVAIYQLSLIIERAM